MADSIAGSYATLAGIEFVNDHRTFSYLANGLGPSSLNIRGDCGCSNIVELLDCPEVTGYISPETDNAPWYSADNPASAGFLGFLTDEFEGMNSTFTRQVSENIGNGGVLNRSRLGTREMTWRGFLFGSSCCSVQYGLRWLSKTLSRFDSQCRDCFGDDLELLVCCPDADAPATGIASPFRLLKGVGLISGPEILSERKTCTSNCSGGCGGSCILEVEFTLVATQPYFYNTPVPVYDCINLLENATTPVTDDSVDCGPEDCSDVFFGVDGLCEQPALPPTAVYTNSCFGTMITPLATYLTVPSSAWTELEEVVPVISITTGPLSVARLQLGFYTSATDNPCGDLLSYPPDCDVVCDELGIIAIPANSTFYIDGRTQKMSVICPNQQPFPGERLTTGPWSWPSFSCYGFCLEILFDSAPGAFTSSGYEFTCVSLTLVPRTF